MPALDGSGVFVLVLATAALLGGTVATYAFDSRTSFGWRLVSGACIGHAALGLIGFSLALRFGLTAWVLVLASALAASPALLLLSNRHRQALGNDLATTIAAIPVGMLRDRSTVVGAGVCVVGVALLWLVADRAMFVREDGIYTGISHNLGDLPFHLSVINRFVYGDNYPPEHPSFAGVRFTYPFLTDFIGAMFVRAGADVATLIVWSTLLAAVALALLMYRWTLDLTRNGVAAALAPVLLFLSGGLGWWMFLAEAGHHDGGVLGLLARLPHDYTITYDNQFRWGNFVTTLLVPQRGLLLGLPLALIVFQNWWQATSAPEQDRRASQARMIAAGVIAGLVPLVHAHTFAVIVGVAACQFVLSRDRWGWTLCLAWALALGLPQILWITQSSGIESRSFVEWSIGWDHGNQNVVLFWLKNAGLFLPLLLVALFWRGSGAIVDRRLLLFYLPFTLCFIVPNLFRLAPWIWDNVKVLTYWFVASVPLVALLLARLAQRGWGRRVAAAGLLAALTFAGALDLWRVASGAFEARIFDRDGIELAALISSTTSPTALILHAPTYNHPVVLSGRRSLMGYAGHVWSHGLDAGPREADIRRIYAGDAAAAALLGRYGIDYVVVGPEERSQMPINERFFEQYPHVGTAGGYRLYRTSSAQD